MSSGGKKSEPAHAPFNFDNHPTDLTLIEDHLRPWVLGTAGWRKHAFLHEADLYAKGPEELAQAFAPAVSQDGERAWYFLTRLRRKSPHGRGGRFVRKVDTDAGWWHGEAKERPVVDVLAGGRQVGLRQYFAFMSDRDGARVRMGWIMWELSLYDVDDLRVLCKVYRSPRHRGGELRNTEPFAKGEETDATAAAAAAADDDDDESSETVTDAPACLGNAKNDECDTETPPAHREGKRKAADDAESSAAAEKRTADDDNKSDTSKIHCPRCRLCFHIDADQVDPVEGGDTGDSESEQRNLKLHNFF